MKDLINDRGCWMFEDEQTLQAEHMFDPSLCIAICNLLSASHARDCYDFGCGMGQYVQAIREAGIKCWGYDGNPNTPKITKGLCGYLDLSKPFGLGVLDWVVSLEVGEHIPAQYEDVFLDNVCLHARHGVVLSWCIPEKDWPVESGVTKEGGLGHVNCRTNEHVYWKMQERNFKTDIGIAKLLRKQATHVHFKYTTMAFHRVI